MVDVDVAVLGGGPAGAAAARLLALWGHRVVLLTRPLRGPALAESLTPSCGKLLDRIGVLDDINLAGVVRSTGHTVKWGSADARVESFDGDARGWQVLRDDLDRVLLRGAQHAGARVHRHVNVRRVTRVDDGTWRVAYESRHALRHVSASWVIDCTGRSGLMSRANSGRIKNASRTVALVGTWERRPHWHLANESHTHVESYPGGWAWSVPVSRTRRQVTIMLDPTRTTVGTGRRLANTYREELARTSMIRAMTERARPVGPPWARDASSYSCESPHRRHLLIAGDAASFVDPLSSFGVKKALASAWLAAVVVHSVMGDASLETAAFDLFASRERAMVAGLQRELEGLTRDAAGAHAAEFWSTRAGAEVEIGVTEPDVAALRLDAEVRVAFEEIRTRETLVLRPMPDLRRELRAVVTGNTVSLEDHLIVPSFPDGIRYIRNVDLMVLATLACRHEHVPVLYEAYRTEGGPASLPDVLGALAVLVGKRILRFA